MMDGRTNFKLLRHIQNRDLGIMKPDIFSRICGIYKEPIKNISRIIFVINGRHNGYTYIM